MENEAHVIRVIGVQLVLKIGIIGYKNYAAKLISVIEKHTFCRINAIYHPTKLIDDKRSTNKISDLFNSDAVFVASPNHTHFDYIEKLINNSNGYIFCTKPPVTSLKELKKLETFSNDIKQRIFFDFNVRFSRLSTNLKSKLNSAEIGKVFYISFIFTQGLAFKKIYTNSWRSDGKNNLYNILDTVSIHYLDLLNLHIGKPKKITIIPNLISNNGSSYDTINLVLKYDNGITASILNSYASPLINELMIIGTNGFFTARNNELTIYSPRDTFDTQGFFTNPPIIDKSNFNISDDSNTAIFKSVNRFLSHVKNGTPIDLHYFNSSILTNQMILNLKEKK